MDREEDRSAVRSSGARSVSCHHPIHPSQRRRAAPWGRVVGPRRRTASSDRAVGPRRRTASWHGWRARRHPPFLTALPRGRAQVRPAIGDDAQGSRTGRRCRFAYPPHSMAVVPRTAELGRKCRTTDRASGRRAAPTTGGARGATARARRARRWRTVGSEPIRFAGKVDRRRGGRAGGVCGGDPDVAGPCGRAARRRIRAGGTGGGCPDRRPIHRRGPIVPRTAPQTDRGCASKVCDGPHREMGRAEGSDRSSEGSLPEARVRDCGVRDTRAPMASNPTGGSRGGGLRDHRRGTSSGVRRECSDRSPARAIGGRFTKQPAARRAVAGLGTQPRPPPGGIRSAIGLTDGPGRRGGLQRDLRVRPGGT